VHGERRCKQRPGHHNQVPAKNNERATANSGLGTNIKYLGRTTSGAASYGLGSTIKHLRRPTGTAAGSSLDTTLNNLRGAASNGRAQHSSTFDEQSAAAGNGLSITVNE
jgi:hypothetical protein